MRSLAAFLFWAALWAHGAQPSSRFVPVKVAEPLKVGTLAIYPLVGAEPASAVTFVSLRRALRSDDFQVVDRRWGDDFFVSEEDAVKTGQGIVRLPGGAELELGGPTESIPGGGAVEMRNRMVAPVLALAGEVLSGADQDRMVSRDVVLEPGQSSFQPVFCVEHGRSHGDSPRFRAVAGMADAALRRRGLGPDDQEEVWRWVANSTRRLGATTGTGTYVAILDGRASHRWWSHGDALLGQLGARGIAPRMLGLAVAVHGRLVSADAFQTPALFREYSRELFDAALVGAELSEETSETTLTPQEVSDALATARGERKSPELPPWARDRLLHADTLAYRGWAIHTRYLPH